MAAILSRPQCVNSSGAEAALSQENYVSVIGMAPYIAGSSAAMSGKHINIFHEEWFQTPTPFQCQEIWEEHVNFYMLPQNNSLIAQCSIIIYHLYPL